MTSRVCGWPYVWQPTPRTADVTVTKIAGYVRVRILMNRWFFFVYLAFILFTLRPLCYILLPACNSQWTCGSLMQPVGDCGGGLDVASMASQQCWGCHCGQARHNSILLGVSLRARWEQRYMNCVMPITRHCYHTRKKNRVHWLAEWNSTVRRT